MSKSRIKNDLLLAAGIGACLIAVFALASFLENRTTVSEFDPEPEELSMQGEKLKGWVLGFEGLLADWYWIRSLQYIGDKLHNAEDSDIDLHNLKPLDPKLLYPLLDNATSLDPQFLAVYSYGANVLPAIDKDHAIAIAEKGVKNNPDEWTLYHQLAYIYWKLGDYDKAAQTYSSGSDVKGAPIWMKSMSARMRSEGGSRDTARAIYRQLFSSASDSQTKESVRLRLLALDADDDIEALDKALAKFKSKNGTCPTGWIQIHDILTSIDLPDGRDFRIDSLGNVVDPTGAPYLLDSKNCKTKTDYSKSELPRS